MSSYSDSDNKIIFAYLAKKGIFWYLSFFLQTNDDEFLQREAPFSKQSCKCLCTPAYNTIWSGNVIITFYPINSLLAHFLRKNYSA